MAGKLRNVLVTGASSGIGLASVHALRKAGLEVFAGVRSVESASDLHAKGVRTVWLDVTDEASLQQAVATVEAEWGGIDVLVNSAGYGVMGPMEELSLEVLRRQFEVNVFGLLRLSQLVLPGMRRRRSGRIINVGSVGGLFTAPGAGGYHMSKYAVESLSDALRAEVRGFGIQVCLLEPTGVRTPFIEKQIATMAADGPDIAYAAFKSALAKNAKALFEPGSQAVVSAQAVADVIVHAATSRKPRTRYRVGAVARILPIVRRWMSDRSWDRFTLAQIGVEHPKRGS